jgi:hypothetical protein
MTKALANYHVRNGRAQNSLLFPCQCHKSSLNHWSMALHIKREEVDNKKKSLVSIHSKPLINDSNYFYGIGKGKVMNSAHGRYKRDSLSLL